MFVDIAWYSWIAIYIVGFMVTVFLFNLSLYDPYTRNGNMWMVPCSVIWPVALPAVGVYQLFLAMYNAPAKLAEHCRKAIAKWGE